MSNWINGDWVTGQGERRVKTNPVSHEALWHGFDADAAQVEQAYQAARAAFPLWARQPFSASGDSGNICRAVGGQQTGAGGDHRP